MNLPAGIFVGKQLGVFATAWIVATTGLVLAPTGASRMQVYGATLLCGMGFAMSLSNGTLPSTIPHMA